MPTPVPFPFACVTLLFGVLWPWCVFVCVCVCACVCVCVCAGAPAGDWDVNHVKLPEATGMAHSVCNCSSVIANPNPVLAHAV